MLAAPAAATSPAQESISALVIGGGFAGLAAVRSLLAEPLVGAAGVDVVQPGTTPLVERVALVEQVGRMRQQ
jgi:NADH dehydrogenase FAD-containing subunit